MLIYTQGIITQAYECKFLSTVRHDADAKCERPFEYGVKKNEE